MIIDAKQTRNLLEVLFTEKSGFSINLKVKVERLKSKTSSPTRFYPARFLHTVRPKALTTPPLTVGPPGSPRALPIATTQLPTWNCRESLSFATGRSSPIICKTARSYNGCPNWTLHIQISE